MTNMKEKILLYSHICICILFIKFGFRAFKLNICFFIQNKKEFSPAQICPLRSGLFKFKALKISQSVVVLEEGTSVAEVYSHLLNLWLMSGSQATSLTLQKSKDMDS